MIYFDNSATTKPYEKVIEKMDFVQRNIFSNPSSLHKFGFEAEKIIESSRKIIADYINCQSNEIIFTQSGSIANNLAVLKSVLKHIKKGGKIILSSVEHPSVSNCGEELSKMGFEVIYCDPVLSEFEKQIDEKTILVSAMFVNNETGMILPVDKIKNIIKRKKSNAIFHIDAVQALSKVEIDVKKLGCDLLSMSAHKIGGPKGAGALFVKEKTFLSPVIFGGGQEKGLVSSTYNTPAILGFATAVEIVKEKDINHIKKLNDYFKSRAKEFDFIKINSPANSAPHILSVSFLGYVGENILHFLEEKDIFVSVGSACSSKRLKNKSLTSLKMPDDIIKSAVRISFCFENTVDEIDEFFKAVGLIEKNLIKTESARRK